MEVGGWSEIGGRQEGDRRRKEQEEGKGRGGVISGMGGDWGGRMGGVRGFGCLRVPACLVACLLSAILHTTATATD